MKKNMESIPIKPLLRWAGGKTWLIKYLKQIIGDIEFNNYHEPFLGGGAVFFALNPKKKSYLSDSNEELINTYKIIRYYPKKVIEELAQFKNTQEDYYKIRSTYNKDDIYMAARFIYLNQTSYNGLYRVNKSGKYNVPYGFRKNLHIDKEKIFLISKRLKSVNLKYGDFIINKNNIKEGDLVFLDPPYTVSHNKNGFIEYNKNLFSLEDQYRLSEYIDFIKSRGGYYILTNAAHMKIEDIFGTKGDNRLELFRNSLIGGKYAKREEVSEYIYTNLGGDLQK